MNKLISSKITALTFGVLVICFAIGFYVVAWQEPTEAPPEGNVPTPINIGTEPQAKAGRISATEFYDYNDPNYYLNPSSDSKLDSLTIVGGSSLPTCDSSFRGKLFLLQSSSGTEDGLYVCKKKADDSYDWIALASPPKWVKIDKPWCGEDTRVSYTTGGNAYCCTTDGGGCNEAKLTVAVGPDGSREITAEVHKIFCVYSEVGPISTTCCGATCGYDWDWGGWPYWEASPVLIW